MDTKLKNYRYSVWFKLFAIVLCVAGMLTLAYGLLKAPYFEAAFQNKDFKESRISKDTLIETYNQVSDIAFHYKNEEHIKTGGLIDQDQLNNRTYSLLSDKEIALQDIENNYNQLLLKYAAGVADTTSADDNSPSEIFIYPEVATEAQDNSSSENTPTTVIESEKEYNQKRINDLMAQKSNDIKQLNQKYDELIKSIKTDYIKEQLSNFHSQLENLNKKVGVFYTVVEDEKVTFSNLTGNSYTNVQDFYKELPLYSKFTSDDLQSFSSNSYAYTAPNIPNNAVVYLGITQDKYNAELAVFTKNIEEGLTGIKISSAGLLAFLLSLIYLIYAAGRRVDKEGVHLIGMDNVYLDAALVVSATAIVLCISQLSLFVRYLVRGKTYLNTNLLYIIFGIVISIGTLIGILYVTMFSKRAKRHEVIKHTLIFKISAWFIRNVRLIYANISSNINSVFDRSPLAMRLVLIFGAYALAIMICILLFFAGPVGVLMGFFGVIGVNVFSIYFLLKAFKAINNIKDGAERIRAGELSYNIPEPGIPELRQLSMTINKIADGLKTAVGSQVRAERMKAELITNVSHDLKTPLTSIITYVDLLKNEGLQSESANKYLGIIDTKSQRLKTLTEDLFEAAKATSGNLSVHFEKLDIASLINQGLGELFDKIEASGLSFKSNLPSEKLFVTADGKLLWRVIENLLSNVFKYALPNSRVYIDVAAHDDKVNIIIKNISAYELNVNEDELMERFKRGDASRQSEGSGLGLSIAKSLTELQGGTFHINIDGDLFKASIMLPKSSEE